MNHNHWTIAALFFVLLSVSGCSNLLNPANTPTSTEALSIVGKFVNGAVTSYFSAKEATSKSVLSRATTGTISLTGTLDDGDITFRLSGTYDTTSGAYTLSAASSTIRYAIGGEKGGKSTASIATRTSSSEAFGTPVIVSVDTSVTTTEASTKMTSTSAAVQTTGLSDTSWQGVWYDTSSGDVSQYIINEWGLKTAYKTNGTWTDGPTMGFSSLKTNSDGSVDLVADYTTVDWSGLTEGTTSSSSTVSAADFPRYWKEKGGLVFSLRAYPTLSDGGDCLVYAEPKELKLAELTYAPSVSVTSGYSVLSYQGVQVGDSIIQIKYSPVVWGTAEKPFAIVWTKISAVQTSGFLAPSTPEGTSYATLAQALAHLETSLGTSAFKAADYLALDPEYTKAIGAIHTWLTTNLGADVAGNATARVAYRAVILNALKTNVTALSGLTDALLLIDSEPSYSSVVSAWGQSGEAVAWIEKKTFSEKVTTYYIAIRLSATGNKLSMTLFGDTGTTESDLSTMSTKVFKTRQADAAALLSTGTPVSGGTVTLTR